MAHTCNMVVQPCFAYHLLQGLRSCLPLCICILPTLWKGTLNITRWWKLWKLKVWNFFGMLKLDEFYACTFQACLVWVQVTCCVDGRICYRECPCKNKLWTTLWLWHWFGINTCLVDIGGSTKGNNIFVYDFVASIKLNVGDLYNMYTTLVKRYDDPHF